MLKRRKEMLSKVVNKFEKSYHMLLITVLSIMSTTKQAYAGQPKLVSGTLALFQAATGWLMLLIPAGAGLVLGYHAIAKALTEDQAIIAEKNKLMKNVLIGSAIATTASGLVTIVLGFYK